jgi:hypothetical protein
MKRYDGVEVSGQLHTPAALNPENQALCLLYRRLGGPHSRSVRYGEEMTVLPVSGIEPSDSSVVQLVV